MTFAPFGAAGAAPAVTEAILPLLNDDCAFFDYLSRSRDNSRIGDDKILRRCSAGKKKTGDERQ